MGQPQGECLKVGFYSRLRLEFHDSKVTMRTPYALLHSMTHVLALVFLLLSVTVLTAAGQSRPDSVQYDVYANGKKVGRMSYSFAEQPGDSGRLLRTKYSLKIGFRVFLVLKVSMDVWQETLRNEDGAFSFYRKAKGEGHNVVQKGYFDGSKLVCDMEIDGKSQHQEFDDSLFDCTSMDSPEADLAPGEEKTVRILGMETLKVHKSTIRYLRDEDLCVGEDTVHCKVIHFKTGRHKGLRWVTRDRYGILIKEESEDPHIASFLPVSVVWNRKDRR